LWHFLPPFSSFLLYHSPLKFVQLLYYTIKSAFDTRGVLPGSELNRLQKEVADLRMENEILKKATAYFAERNKKG